MCVPNGKIQPKVFTMDGIKPSKLTSILQTGSDDKIFEGRWHEERVKDNPLRQDAL